MHRTFIILALARLMHPHAINEIDMYFHTGITSPVDFRKRLRDLIEAA